MNIPRLPSRMGLPVLAVLSFAFMGYHLVRSQQQPPDPPPPVQPTRSPYGHAVAAAGVVEAQSENITVGSPLPGVVVEVAVLEGQSVGPGDLLLRLDDRQLRGELEVRQAQLAVARASLTKLQAAPRSEELPPSQARVRKAQAELIAQEDLLRRREKLAADRTVSEEELIQRRQAVVAAREYLDQAQAEFALLKAGAWEPELELAQAEVLRCESLVQQTQIELARLEVRSPIAGSVLKVDVRPGEYVGTPPGSPLITVGNIERLHVRVDIDEQDIPRYQTGSEGTAFVRGDATQPLPIAFVRVEPYVQPKVSLVGRATERVDTRVLQVLYAFEPAVQGVFVGQQVDVYLRAVDQGRNAPPSAAPAAGAPELAGPAK